MKTGYLYEAKWKCGPDLGIIVKCLSPGSGDRFEGEVVSTVESCDKKKGYRCSTFRVECFEEIGDSVNLDESLLLIV